MNPTAKVLNDARRPTSGGIPAGKKTVGKIRAAAVP